ncbi:CpsD/CapB family tyrosine-protein kinase [Cytobacillus sp. S13-E01]|uniref:CpsD/CapB family tyrosine-protein kinase n=1 Tax=Cytobacillus sp. S13-E01 TaxID=3031326 RepID=UPI0023D884BB|nr:CpsD/CapB family tyrosine-protein kinase [Cytobacillus sp. S13-E01]MDF0728524.1 CpsD/CapB family tyrosine-protein kinase [Cytobacillus sp. S13-E01]
MAFKIMNPFTTKDKRNLVTHSSPNSNVSEQFKTIRANIQILIGDNRNQTLLFTSTKMREGNTTTVANLAVAIAQQKEKVLLIDANLRQPRVHSIFNVPNTIGLSNVLTDNTSVEDAILQSDISGLNILTSGPKEDNPSEILGLRKMKDLLNLVRNSYDIVLIDSPSVLEAAETRVLANRCDGVLLVVNQGKTVLDKALEARKVLHFSNAKLMGVILNDGK